MQHGMVRGTRLVMGRGLAGCGPLGALVPGVGDLRVHVLGDDKEGSGAWLKGTHSVEAWRRSVATPLTVCALVLHRRQVASTKQQGGESEQQKCTRRATNKTPELCVTQATAAPCRWMSSQSIAWAGAGRLCPARAALVHQQHVLARGAVRCRQCEGQRQAIEGLEQGTRERTSHAHLKNDPTGHVSLHHGREYPEVLFIAYNQNPSNNSHVSITCDGPQPVSTLASQARVVPVTAARLPPTVGPGARLARRSRDRDVSSGRASFKRSGRAMDKLKAPAMPQKDTKHHKCPQ
jgi:hypothetical protein